MSCTTGNSTRGGAGRSGVPVVQAGVGRRAYDAATGQLGRIRAWLGFRLEMRFEKAIERSDRLERGDLLQFSVGKKMKTSAARGVDSSDQC